MPSWVSCQLVPLSITPAASIRAVSCHTAASSFTRGLNSDAASSTVDGSVIVEAVQRPDCCRMTFDILDRLLDLLFASA